MSPGYRMCRKSASTDFGSGSGQTFVGCRVLVATGYALTSFLTLLVRPGTSLPTWWQGVLGVICVVAVLALGMFVRARRQLALIERERAASEQELRVAQARQMERNRIAREMHDVLAHRCRC